MITLYTKDQCPYCDMAKSFLDSHSFAYEAINIAENNDAKEFIVSRGHRSVPQIYKDGEVLVMGGWSALREIGVDGLKRLLNS